MALKLQSGQDQIAQYTILFQMGHKPKNWQSRVPVPSHCLMLVDSCMKFDEDILNYFKLERT